MRKNVLEPEYEFDTAIYDGKQNKKKSSKAD